MKIEEDNMYQEGYWAGRSVAEHVEKTTYKDLKTAIEVKNKVLKQFEGKFRYSREMKEFDTNYSYNVRVVGYSIQRPEGQEK